MNVTIIASTLETDKKLKKIFNWILPTKGNTLYIILDDVNIKSQTITLDGRTIEITIEPMYDSITFGPIK